MRGRYIKRNFRILRNKSMLFVGLALIGSVFLFLAFTYINLGQTSANSEIKKIKEVVTQDSVGERFDIVEYTVKDGDAWGRIARAVGLGDKLGANLLAASLPVHNLAGIRAGNEFRFLFGIKGGKFESLEYDINDKEFLKIEKDREEKLKASKADISYKVNLVEKSGTIENFLFEVAEKNGVPESVILDLAWIFSWDIDFASSIQAGDSFALIYEDRFRGDEQASPGRILASRFNNNGKDFHAFYYINKEGYGSYYDMDGRELRRQFLRSPLDYERITSGFSYNRFHPILDTFTTHRAVDYAADSGTPVSATANGTVTFVGWSGGNGKFVSIRHANGYSTGYAHLSNYAKGIAIGAKVEQNDVIGFVGSTGLSTGPHLHYEMRKDGVLINPLRLDLPPGTMMKDDSVKDFFNERDKLLKLLK